MEIQNVMKSIADLALQEGSRPVPEQADAVRQDQVRLAPSAVPSEGHTRRLKWIHASASTPS